ncbi:MFS transporter, partial [Flavobacteriaceae bacterium]|nr:MFS transporter [Flavobacteriaceae bacterium]
DFFFVSGQIYTDSKAGEKVKSAAQGLITLATYGVGMLVGFWIAGQVVDKNLLSDSFHAWQDIWIFPAVFAVVVMVIFAVLFKDEKIEYKG